MGLLRRLLGAPGCRFWGGPGIATRKWAAGRHDHVESCAECRARQQRERQYLEKLRGAAVPEASEDLTARLLARTGQLAAERAAAERTAEAEREQTAPEAAVPAATAPAPTAPTPSAPSAPERAMAERPDPADTADVLDAAERPGAADAAGAGHRPRPSDRFPAGHPVPGRPGTTGPVAGRAAAAGPHGARRRGPRLPVLAVGGAVAALALMTGTAYVMGGDDAVPAEGAGDCHPRPPGCPRAARQR